MRGDYYSHQRGSSLTKYVKQVLQNILHLLQKISSLNRSVYLLSTMLLIFLAISLNFNFGSWDQKLLTLQPNSENIRPFCDQEEGGTSTCLVKHGDTSQLIYSITPGYPYPYAGISYRLGSISKLDTVNSKISECWDFTPYDSIKITSSASHTTGVALQLVGRMDSLSSELYRILQVDVPVKQYVSENSLSLEELAIPKWWRAENNLGLGSRSKKFDQICRVELIAGDYMQGKTNDTLNVVQIQLIGTQKDKALVFGLLSILLFLIILGLIIWKIQLRRYTQQFHKKIHQPGEGLATEEGDSWVTIHKWFLKNYTNPDCSLSKAAKDLPIPSRIISQMVLKNTGQIFRAFLLELRLKEASRLLLENDGPISQIAYAAGFANVSNFNRCFKNEFGHTPKDWRNLNKRN